MAVELDREALRSDLAEALRLALMDEDASYQEISDGLIDGVLARYLAEEAR